MASASVDGPPATVPPATLGDIPESQAADDEGAVPGPSQSPPNDASDPSSDQHVPGKTFIKSEDDVAKALSVKTGKLSLLELPVDILRLIVQEVKHSNDITSLALTNSTLHSLAVPRLYSKFDIVWPDGQLSTSDSKGVDALTYGLSTLCLGSSFARRIGSLRNTASPSSTGQPRLLRRNNYASYVRKFSLGNGLPEWVSEYHISKESGKMLGTLVALAVEKMVNLETFVWDMPSGVLADVFLSLASLQDDKPDNACKLESVWIRWHDSTTVSPMSASTISPGGFDPQLSTPPLPIGATLTPIGILPPASPPPSPSSTPGDYNDACFEYPTFSVLPPLRSLTVLEIEEQSYLDEMSILIERSKDKLHELRVGISARVSVTSAMLPWDGSDLHQIEHGPPWPYTGGTSSRRLGGVLGILLGRIYDIRRKPPAKPKENGSAAVATSSSPQAPGTITYVELNPTVQGDAQGNPSLYPTEALVLESAEIPSSTPQGSSAQVDSPAEEAETNPPSAGDESYRRREGKLKLRTLELERVALSMQVCTMAIDWSVLTTLTILSCAYHEHLWKLLRRQNLPTSNIPGPKGLNAYKTVPPGSLQYHLALKHIHTDIVSPALINFIKDTLAPNTLETVFLHDRQPTPSPSVTMDLIFRSVIMRHRASLRQLLLNSTSQSARANGLSTRARYWAPNTDMLLYLTSGRMSQLRELAIVLRYKDWHTFLQRLPGIPRLRSLYIQYLVGFEGSRLENKHLMAGILDIITLRPEVQLSYVGLYDKCFEIIESEPRARRRGSRRASDLSSGDGGNASDSSSSASDDDDDDDDTASHTSVMTDSDAGDGPDEGPSMVDMGDSQSEGSVKLEAMAGDSDTESLRDADLGLPAREFRSREVLFYDDVAIFKAAYGKL